MKNFSPITEIDKKMHFLINLLNEATESYDKGHPFMTDEEWDRAYFELAFLENEFGYAFKNSPTKRVYFKEVSELKKVKHNHPMLSLKKTKDLKEVSSFLKSQYGVAMLKLDGLTCSLTYNNGKLIAAETRGDGFEGEDILHNINVLLNVPKMIPIKERVVIDGEIICPIDTFEENFAKDFANPRNYAAGAIRRLNSKENENCGLEFIAWDCIRGIDCDCLSDKLNRIEEYGFTVVPLVTCYTPLENVVESLKASAATYSYPIDGIVFKYNNCEYYDSLGATDHHFRGGLAYKFYDETYGTRLERIEWTMGRTGVLTPVAVFEPIDIDGTEVSRASLHNVSVMEEIMGSCCYAGQKLEIFKANQIIPQVYSAEKMSYGDVVANGGISVEGYIDGYIYCPICGEATCVVTSDSGTKNRVCPNAQCEGKLVNQLDHFCGKKGLDIKGISKATLEKFINWRLINSKQDIFILHDFKEILQNKPGFGIKSVEKILNSIEDSKNTTLNKVISSAGIPLIGTTVAKDLAKRFKTYTNFKKAIDNNFQFYSLPNYGWEMYKALTSFDYTELDYIVENFLNIQEEQEENIKNDLEGKVFVVTGKLKQFKNRDAIKQKIESLGGKVSGSVTKKTSYLINNDINSTSSKNITAKTLGVPIITEEDFIKIFDI